MAKNITRRPGSASQNGARPTFDQLEVFLKVAETGSFAATARFFGMSSPAISQKIAKLEDIYGGDLFERRRGAPSLLTPIGQAILPKAKSLLFTVDQQIKHAVEVAHSANGALSLGIYPSLARGPLQFGIGQFRNQHPDVQLNIVEASPSDLHQRLNDRVVDMIVVAFLPEFVSSTNEHERLWEEPLIIGLQADDPLSQKSSISIDDLSTRTVILRSNSGDLSAYRSFSRCIGDREIGCHMHDVSRETLIDLARLGFGPVVQFASAQVSRDGMVFLPIVDDAAYAPIVAAWPKNDRNPIRHRLLNMIRDGVRQGTP